MANKYASIVQSGTNNYLTSALDLNGDRTDTILPGIVGALTNTSGVAPSTGSFAVNAQGSPNMTVAVSAGQAYVSATPTGGTAQTIRVTSDASENVTIASNSTGSTRYDFVYIKLDPDKMNNPAVTGLDVVTLIVQRSTTLASDSNGTPANSLLLAIVSVANGASSITNSNIQDVRILCSTPGDGWVSANESWTYASATTITVPTNATFKYSVGDKIRLIQSGSAKFFYITGVAATTLTINGGTDYTLANAAIIQPCYSKRATPQGFPQWFAYTPTWTAASVNPAIGNGSITGKFTMNGKTVTARCTVVYGSTTTFGAGNYRITYPISSVTWSAAEDLMGIGLGHYVRNGVANYIIHGYARTAVSSHFEMAVQASAGGAGTYPTWSNFTQAVPATSANGDSFRIQVTYEAA